MRSESEFVLFLLVRQGTGRGGGPRPRLSDPLPVGAARGVVSCRGEMLLPAATLHAEKWRWGAIRSERLCPRALPARCTHGCGLWPVGGSYRARSLRQAAGRSSQPFPGPRASASSPRRSSRRAADPPCPSSSNSNTYRKKKQEQGRQARVAVALQQPYPRRRHLVGRADGRGQRSAWSTPIHARNACRYRPGQLARRGRPRARRPPSEPRGADRRPPAADADARATRVPPQASVARRGSAWFSRSCWWSDHAIRRRALGDGGLVVLVRAKVGAKQARATVLCACGALGERCRARHVEVPHRASVPLLEKSLLFPVQPSPLPCHRVPAKNSYRQICRPVGLSGLQGV